MELPEIIFTGQEGYSKSKVYQLTKRETIRPLVNGVYTSNFSDSAADIIWRNWQLILSQLYPESILSHRTALEFRPTANKNIYITHNTRRVLKWPGLTIRMVKGPKALEGDNPIYGHLHVSSLERALLENLSTSRMVEGERRTVDQAMIENRLVQELNVNGEDGINKVRDRAREISEKLRWEKPFKKLNAIIAALLNSQSADMLSSDISKAVALGEPYDASRVALFSLLIAELRSTTFADRFAKTIDHVSYQNIAFIESYFSNYIEGTEFAIDEARDILFHNIKIPNRTGDSHDIKGTFELCNDQVIMSSPPKSASDLIGMLKSYHSILLRGRPEKQPGRFKNRANRAGETFFVSPNQVIGTLKHAFELSHALSHPLAKAIYMMFVVSEVHPFADGNGRMARLMMNIELSSKEFSKIIIPTVYRDDYLLNLRALTRKREASKFIKMMDKAQRFTHWLNPGDFEDMNQQLLDSRAYAESNETALRF